MLAGKSLDVDAELARLTEALAGDFAGKVNRVEIEHSVRDARREFGDPPITQFLPILIERKVRSLLSR